MDTKGQTWLKKGAGWSLLLLIIMGLGCIFYFHGYKYFSFASLKQHHEQLHQWAEHHYILSLITYMLVYIIAVALSVPGAVFITLAGGYLFGPIATLYVVISATIGATLLFLVVRTTLGDWLRNRVKTWSHKMKAGIYENAFYYLLFLRLIPLFPFWVVNIVPALLNVKAKTFILATLIGIIPGSLVYVMIGNGLNKVFATNQEPDLHIIFTPAILFPILGLAILAISPVIYKHWKGKKS